MYDKISLLIYKALLQGNNKKKDTINSKIAVGGKSQSKSIVLEMLKNVQPSLIQRNVSISYKIKNLSYYIDND